MAGVIEGDGRVGVELVENLSNSNSFILATHVGSNVVRQTFSRALLRDGAAAAVPERSG